MWGTTYKIIQFELDYIFYKKQIIRTIIKSNFDTHTTPLFYEYGLLNLDNIHTLQIIGLFKYTCFLFTINHFQEDLVTCFARIHRLTQQAIMNPNIAKLLLK